MWLKLSLERQEPDLFTYRLLYKKSRAVVCCFGFETNIYIASMIRGAYGILMHVAPKLFS